MSDKKVLNNPERLHLKTPILTGCVVDSFNFDTSSGEVIGSNTDSGAVRFGCDRDRTMAVDNRALRLGYMPKPGWGRQGISYGPFLCQAGMVFTAYLINGHNGSQTCVHWTDQKRRIVKGVLRRLLQWIPKKCLPIRLRSHVYPERTHDLNWPHIRENLSVGFFRHPKPVDPRKKGNTFLMCADDISNAKLLVCNNGCRSTAVETVQNIPIYYTIALRPDDVIYYVSSVPGARGLPGYPTMRPIAIAPRRNRRDIYAAIYQSILGEVGFRTDTRVYGIKICTMTDWSMWCGGSQAAHRFCGVDNLDGSQGDCGPAWTVVNGRFILTEQGIRAALPNSLATIYTDQPSGLIRAFVRPGPKYTSFAIRWRMKNRNKYLGLCFEKDRANLIVHSNGTTQLVQSTPVRLKFNKENEVSIVDDGCRFSLFLNGSRLFDNEIVSEELNDATGIGVWVQDPEPATFFRNFESHPRNVRIPHELDLGAPWNPQGIRKIVDEGFEGTKGDLAGRSLGNGQGIWRKDFGRGVFVLTGNGGVRVKADVDTPNPGRTFYTLEWKHKRFAELESEIIPPGKNPDRGHKGRAGFVFWQDEDSYIIINTYLDDWKVGKSISTFFHLSGQEDIYQAVWTNVDHRIHWGIAYKLRVVFDGMHYLVHLNDEPVLYRSLTDIDPVAHRLSIERVGLVANWEFGNDTGSEFRSFVARTR